MLPAKMSGHSLIQFFSLPGSLLVGLVIAAEAKRTQQVHMERFGDFFSNPADTVNHENPHLAIIDLSERLSI